MLFNNLFHSAWAMSTSSFAATEDDDEEEEVEDDDVSSALKHIENINKTNANKKFIISIVKGKKKSVKKY